MVGVGGGFASEAQSNKIDLHQIHDGGGWNTRKWVWGWSTRK